MKRYMIPEGTPIKQFEYRLENTYIAEMTDWTVERHGDAVKTQCDWYFSEADCLPLFEGHSSVAVRVFSSRDMWNGFFVLRCYLKQLPDA